MKKSQFSKLYNKLPTTIVVQGLNQIIEEHRKSISFYKDKQDKIKYSKTIFKPEMEEFANTYGWPDQYEPEPKTQN